jgi:hypothetical protein
MLRWYGCDVVKCATFYAEEVLKSTADFNNVVTQKDRYE